MASNKQAIFTGVMGILQNAQYNNAPLLQATYQGEQKDYQNQSPVAAVMFDPTGTDTKYEELGGKVNDYVTIRVRFLVDFSNTLNAEQTLIHIYDTVVPLFQTQRRLGGVANVRNSFPYKWRTGYQPIRGTTYRVGDLSLLVWEQYPVTPTN